MAVLSDSQPRYLLASAEANSRAGTFLQRLGRRAAEAGQADLMGAIGVAISLVDADKELTSAQLSEIASAMESLRLYDDNDNIELGAAVARLINRA